LYLQSLHISQYQKRNYEEVNNFNSINQFVPFQL